MKIIKKQKINKNKLNNKRFNKQNYQREKKVNHFKIYKMLNKNNLNLRHHKNIKQKQILDNLN